MIHFPTRLQNVLSMAIDNICIDTTRFKNFISMIINGLSDHDAHLLLIKDLNS